MPIFQRSAVEGGYCRALMRRLAILSLMPSPGSALVQATPGILSDSIVGVDDALRVMRRPGKPFIHFEVECARLDACVLLCCCRKRAWPWTRRHCRTKVGLGWCACLQCVCTVGRTRTLCSANTRHRGRVQTAPDELSRIADLTTCASPPAIQLATNLESSQSSLIVLARVSSSSVRI